MTRTCLPTPVPQGEGILHNYRVGYWYLLSLFGFVSEFFFISSFFLILSSTFWSAILISFLRVFILSQKKYSSLKWVYFVWLVSLLPYVVPHQAKDCYLPVGEEQKFTSNLKINHFCQNTLAACNSIMTWYSIHTGHHNKILSMHPRTDYLTYKHI